MRVLVTGASGFVGRALVPVLEAAGHDVTASSRKESAPELGPEADWSTLLHGVEAVVHLAGRAHVPSETTGADVEALHHRINAEGTRALARQAASFGVRRFVFVSSCHAVAAESDEPLTRETPPHPVTAYGRSKLAAEAAVREEIGAAGGEWTILRPPLVYGRGNKANFDRLARLVRTGVPLPLGGVQNRRSFVYAGNLADVIATCVVSPCAAGKVFYPSDGRDLSTPELIRLLADAMGLRARLFTVTPNISKTLCVLPGGNAFRKLTASLCVDSSTLRDELGWLPRFKVEEGLAEAFKG